MANELPLLRQTKFLIQKELLLDLRNKAVLGGVVLYTVSVVFIAYMALQSSIPPAPAWSAVVLVILCFSSVNAVARSFSADGREMQTYLYQIASPQAIILSKLVYNFLFTAKLGGITFAAIYFFIGVPEGSAERFGLLLLLAISGSTAFSGILTVVSAIASRGNNNPGLMAILAFPLLIPLIVTLVPLFIETLMSQQTPEYQLLPVPFALNLLAAAMGYLLFPYLWRD